MADRPPSQLLDEYDTPSEYARRAFVTGTAVTMPIIVTLIVLGFVVNFVSQQLDPVVGFFTSTTGTTAASELTLKVTAIIVLLGLIFFIGILTEYRTTTSDIGLFFEALISRIPGVGSLYRSLDEMSSLLLDSDTDSFREVKLVEFPVEGSYSIAFLTAETPDVVTDATKQDGMLTVFLPMAPNPVMGGYVLHVAEDRVLDVDLSVEEGIQSIVSSGVATGQQTQDELPEDMLGRINRRLDSADIVAHVEDIEQYAADASSRIEETARERMASAQSTETDRESDDPGRDQ